MTVKHPSRIISLLAKHQAKYFATPKAEQIRSITTEVEGDEEMELTPTSSSPLFGSSPHPPTPQSQEASASKEHEKHEHKEDEAEDKAEDSEEQKKKDAEAEKKKQQPHPGSSGGTVPGSGTPSGGYSPQR